MFREPRRNARFESAKGLSGFHAVATSWLQFPHIIENKLDIPLLSADSGRHEWISEIARAIAGTKWNTEFITGMCLSNYISMYRMPALLIGFEFMPRNGIDTTYNELSISTVVPTLTVRSVALMSMWTDCTKTKMLNPDSCKGGQLECRQEAP